jgi:hypothetical protein
MPLNHPLQKEKGLLKIPLLFVMIFLNYSQISKEGGFNNYIRLKANKKAVPD